MISRAALSWLPWTDRAGRTSWLKLATFLGCIAPGLYMLAEIKFGWLSPKPITDLIRECGDWIIRFLVLTLAITPLRVITRWNKVLTIRRMLGLTALAYALSHFSLYCLDEGFVWPTIASEIVHRFYLTIGFVTLCGLLVLGLTSNDAAIRRLGAKRWNRLHFLTYALGLLGLVHYFIQLRLDATQAALMAGMFSLLIGFRLLRKAGREGNFVALFALAVAAGLATALIEAGYYRIATGVNAAMVLSANLDFSYTVRPAWWVLSAGLVLALLRAGMRLRAGVAPARAARASA